MHTAAIIEVLPQFPLTAWEQIAVVCVFSLVIIAVLYGLLKWVFNFLKNQASTQAELMKAQQDFQESQSNKWQDFLDAKDTKWQKWMETADLRTAGSLKQVADALDKLACKIDDHDDKVDSRFHQAVNEIKGIPPKRTVK